MLKRIIIKIISKLFPVNWLAQALTDKPEVAGVTILGFAEVEGMAAQLDGLAQRALELTNEYCEKRRQISLPGDDVDRIIH